MLSLCGIRGRLQIDKTPKKVINSLTFQNYTFLEFEVGKNPNKSPIYT